MSASDSLYQSLCQTLSSEPGVVTGQLFGKPCIKVRGRAFLAHHQGRLVFKLEGHSHSQALAQPGAVLWDPSSKGRPMKEWVAIPGENAADFLSLARHALAYVGAE